MPSTADIQRSANTVRRRVLAHVLDNGGGYMSQACSSAELLATMYRRVLHLGPSVAPLVPPPFEGVPRAGYEPLPGSAWHGSPSPETDRFLFSPVHYSLVLYAVLIEVGRLAPEALTAFNRDGSTVEMIGAEHSPGIEVTAGSLAQALSVGCGIALARKIRREAGRTWVFMTDGEFQEGQTWEALAAAAHHGLDQLAVLVDANAQQCDGAMAGVMSIEPLAERMAAFGVCAREVDGHDIDAITAATERTDRPLVVIGRTDPCRGLDLLRERAPRLHYLRFADDDERERYADALVDMGVK